MPNYKNSVFIATSLDGYIADQNGSIEWLHTLPNTEQNDMGYGKFMAGIDAIVMGRKTYETVLAFDMDWPYSKPVFVLSNSLKELPNQLMGKVWIVNGELKKVLEHIHKTGYHQLYIDGGTTIQSFLKEDLIDDMVITVIPVLLGGGSPLFAELPHPLQYECSETCMYLGSIVQNRYQRKKT